jgi:hypothetical protein
METQTQSSAIVAGYSTPIQTPDISENANGDPALNKQVLIPAAESWESVVFARTSERGALERLKANTPTTVGDLWWKYLLVLKAEAQAADNQLTLVRALGKINRQMNEYADDNDMCEAYEEALEQFNKILIEEGYRGYFSFEGRTETYSVRVTRHRIVKETIDVDVEMRKNSSDQEVIDEAYEIAGETETHLWEEEDTEYDTEIVSGNIL